MSRSPDENRDAIEEARRDLRAERLEAYVRSVVDQAPPLTQGQRERIAAALRTPDDARNGAPAA